MPDSTDLQRLIIQMEARNARLEKDLAKSAAIADKRARDIEKRFQTMNKKVGSSFSTIGKGLGATLGAFGVGFGLAQLPKAFNDVIKSSADLGVLADRVGLTTDQLQKFQFAADLANVEVSDFNTSITQFVKRLGEASTGSGDLAKILALNNVPLRDQQGNLRPTNDLLLDYADLIKNAANEQEALFLATEAFGKSGASMVSVLGDGSFALKGIGEEARTTGKIINEDLIRRAQELDDEWDRLTRRMSVGWKTFVLDVVTGSFTVIGAWDNLLDKGNAFLHEVTNGLVPLAGGNQPSRQNTDTTNPQLGAMGVPRLPPRKTTQLPVKTDPETEKIENQKQAVVDLISKLEEERKLIGASDVQKAISNALREAGAVATEDQKKKITELITAIETEEAAMEAAKAAQQAFTEGAQSFVHDLVSSMDNGATFVDALTESVVNLGRKLRDIALDKGIEQLLNALLGGGLTGGTGGGLFGFLGSIFGKIEGGMASAGTPIEVGESGREVFIPTTPGRIVPNNQLGDKGSQHIIIELVEGGLLRPIIRQEATNVSVRVSKAAIEGNNRAAARRQALAG